MKELLEINQTNIIEKYIEFIEGKVDSIVIWGGAASEKYIKFLEENNLKDKIIFLADNNKRLQVPFLRALKYLVQ